MRGARQRESGGQRGRGQAAAGSSAYTPPEETLKSLLETLSFCTKSLKNLNEVSGQTSKAA